MAEDDAKGAEGADEPKKKSKKIVLLVIGLALLLLGGGGYFAYIKFLAPPPQAEKGAEHPAEKGEEVGEIIDLEPFVVNLADPKGNRYLKLKIGLEVESKEIAERVKKVTPKLRDTVIMMLTSLSFEEVMTPEGKLRIRDELLERFNRIIRPDKIKNIYFSEFVVQ